MNPQDGHTCYLMVDWYFETIDATLFLNIHRCIKTHSLVVYPSSTVMPSDNVSTTSLMPHDSDDKSDLESGSGPIESCGELAEATSRPEVPGGVFAFQDSSVLSLVLVWYSLLESPASVGLERDLERCPQRISDQVCLMVLSLFTLQDIYIYIHVSYVSVVS
jgi:hypothetical protein